MDWCGSGWNARKISEIARGRRHWRPNLSYGETSKEMARKGQDVRIFTSRVNPYHRRIEALRARRTIEAWSKRHLGRVLPVTHEKDWDMVLLFDDKARQVERNTGRVVSGLFK